MISDQTPEIAKEETKLSEPEPIIIKQKNNFITTLALILAVISLITAICTSYTNARLQKNLKQENSQLSHNLNKQKIFLASLQTTIGINQEENKEQITQLNKALQTIKQQTRTDKEDWMLLKARYYLEIAQIQIHWTHSTEIPIALLQQADNLLAQLTNLNLLNIRQSIAKAILELQSTPKVDIAGLLSQLDAAQDKVNQLNIEEKITLANINSTSEQTSASPWKKQLQNSLNALERMVIIKRQDQEVQPLMSSMHIALLKENINNNLQMAQWALLKQEPKVYLSALQQAIQNIQRSFNTKTPVATALINQLTQLKSAQLSSQKPDLSEPLHLLNQWFENNSTDKTHDTIN